MNWMLLNGGGAVSFDSGGMHFHGMTGNQVLRDFSYSLAHQIRAAGRFGTWSVAKHSLFVALLLPPEMVLEGLIHDAHEAITADIPTPWANSLPASVQAEIQLGKYNVQRAFQQIVGYRPRQDLDMSLVHKTDHRAFLLEVRHFLGDSASLAAENLNLHVGPVVQTPEELAYITNLTKLGSWDAGILWYEHVKHELAERREYVG